MTTEDKEAQTVTQEGVVLPDLDAIRLDARAKVKGYIKVAVEQTMAMITGLLPGYTVNDKAEVLLFSAEHCAAVLDEANQPIDEKAVFAGYDETMKMLDTIPLIPPTWDKFLDHGFWMLPKIVPGDPVRPIGKFDFEALERLPLKHKLHTFPAPWFVPKYKIPEPKQLVSTTEKKEA